LQITRLTVELVETLQILQRKGKPVAELVGQLEAATLPGLIEYGCLRYDQREQFPPLPQALHRLPVGRALLEIPSALGLRSAGAPKAAVRNLNTRYIEFHPLPSEHGFDEDIEWGSFCHRFELAARAVGFSRDAAINLHSALFEMAENAVIHSRTPVAPLVGYAVSSGTAMFTVADVGIGVLESLRSVAQYASLTEDVDAIQLAMQSGVTSRQDGGGGMGFNSVFKALAEQWGQLRFRSGNGCITMDGTNLDANQCRRHFPPTMRGFQVSVCCRAHGPFPPHSRF
jgi:anti-sigma regulatory factor (Ser/Thr protein kinase)